MGVLITEALNPLLLAVSGHIDSGVYKVEYPLPPWEKGRVKGGKA